MGKNFNLIKGVKVPNLDLIKESYCIMHNEKYDGITINVSAENIDMVFRALSEKVRTPGFLLLEHGTHQDIESELRKNEVDPLHKDVFYLDGLQYADFIKLYDNYKELLVYDGMIQFGFGSHFGYDEVFVGKYKILLFASAKDAQCFKCRCRNK